MGRTRQFNEEALIEAATQLFWTQGYDATSLGQLADSTGTGNGSIYVAYGSKLGLFTAVFALYCSSRVDVVRDAMASDPGSARTAVEYFFATIIADCASQPSRRGCLMLNSLSELGIREPSIRATCDRTTAAMELLVARRLLAGLESGQLVATPEECETLGAQVVLVSQGLIQMSRLDTPESKLISVAATSAAMLPWAGPEHIGTPGIAAAGDRITRAVARIRRNLAMPAGTPRGALLGVSVSQSLVDIVRTVAADRLGTAPPLALHRGLVAEIYVYIDRHLQDPDLSPSTIAAAHRVSVRSLHLLFEGSDDTVSRLISKRRLDRARADLQASEDVAIAIVSARWGFGSPSHFTRVFRQQFGLSPSAVQKPRRYVT